MGLRVITRQGVVAVVVGFPERVARRIRCEGMAEGSPLLISCPEAPVDTACRC